MSRQAGKTAHGLDIPDALELQVMDGHDCADAAIERVVLEHLVQINRDQCGLPVMAVDDIRTEADERQHRQHSLGEEAELLDIPQDIAVQLFAVEEMLVVDIIIADTVQLACHNADIEIAQPAQIHIEISDIRKATAILLRDTGIVRNDDTHIVFFLIQGFRKRADNIRQTSGLDKRYAFRCGKQYVLHILSSSILCPHSVSLRRNPPSRI